MTPQPHAPLQQPAQTSASCALTIATVALVDLPLITDSRASLTFAQVGDHLPFVPKRYFAVFGAGPDAKRGEHAHRTLHQFVVCLAGGCTIILDDGTSRDSVRLTSPTVGLHMHPMTWCVLQDFTPDAMVLVLASDVYDEADYIRDYAEFRHSLPGDTA